MSKWIPHDRIPSFAWKLVVLKLVIKWSTQLMCLHEHLQISKCSLQFCFQIQNFNQSQSLWVNMILIPKSETQQMKFFFSLFVCVCFRPVLYLPSPQKASVAVRCCPILFELRQENGVCLFSRLITLIIVSAFCAAVLC